MKHQLALGEGRVGKGIAHPHYKVISNVNARTYIEWEAFILYKVISNVNARTYIEWETFIL